MSSDESPRVPAPPPLVLLSSSEAMTREAGAAWSAAWAATAKPNAISVLTLAGPLGAGKTQVAKGIVAGLGGEPDEVTSPTFTLLDIHATPAAEVHHFDFYRLGGAEDAVDVGLEASLTAPAAGQPRRIVLMEWASRVAEWLPPATHVREVYLEHVGETQRRLTWHGLTAPERAALRHVAGDPPPC